MNRRQKKKAHIAVRQDSSNKGTNVGNTPIFFCLIIAH